MTRTLLIGTETGLAVTTTLGNATVVRVYNGVSGVATVSIAKSTTTGYANTASVTLPQGHVEFFEKAGADQIWASDNAVVGSKVGFTG
jgi:hypothetical protein